MRSEAEAAAARLALLQAEAEQRLQQLSAASAGGADLAAAAARCRQLGCSAAAVAAAEGRFAQRREAAAANLSAAAESGTLEAYRAARAAAVQLGCGDAAIADGDAKVQTRVAALHSGLQALLHGVLEESTRVREAVARLEGDSRSYLAHLQPAAAGGAALTTAQATQAAAAAALDCCAAAVAAAAAADDATAVQAQVQAQPAHADGVASASAAAAVGASACNSAAKALESGLARLTAKPPPPSSGPSGTAVADQLSRLPGVMSNCCKLGLAPQALLALRSLALHAAVWQVSDVSPVLSAAIPRDADGQPLLPAWPAAGPLGATPGAPLGARTAGAGVSEPEQGAAAPACGDAPLLAALPQLRCLAERAASSSIDDLAWPPPLAIAALEAGRARFVSLSSTPASTSPSSASSFASSKQPVPAAAAAAAPAPLPRPGAAPAGAGKALTRAMVAANAGAANLATLQRLDLGLEGLGSVAGLDALCPALRCVTLNANQLTSLAGLAGLAQLQVRLAVY